MGVISHTFTMPHTKIVYHVYTAARHRLILIYLVGGLLECWPVTGSLDVILQVWCGEFLDGCPGPLSVNRQECRHPRKMKWVGGR